MEGIRLTDDPPTHDSREVGAVDAARMLLAGGGWRAKPSGDKKGEDQSKPLGIFMGNGLPPVPPRIAENWQRRICRNVRASA